MPKYLSGRSKRTQQSALKSDINRYLSVGDAEPNLRDPIAPGDAPPGGQQYQIVSVEGFPGQRFWQPIGGGLIPGTISVYDENNAPANLVGGPSSTTQLTFKGAAIRAEGVGNGSPSNPYGVGVTITVFSPGNEQEILFNTANEFSTSSKLKFDTSNGLLSAGDRINVGLGGTVIATTGIGSVGIGTSNPTQKLDLNGDLRLRGTIYDYTNQPGTTSQILIKNNLGGIIWVNQSTIRAGAGGTYQNVQFHNSSGLVDGAPNFVYDEINNRIGIGSTLPRTTLDVLGISSFRGGSFIDSLTVTGVTTTSTLAVSGTSTTRNLVVTGVTTLGFLTGTSAFFTGIVTATKFSGAIDVTNLFVSGISTFKQKVNIDSDLGVTGLTTTRDLQVYQSTTLNRLKVTGISTFDSQVIINNLSVTGVGTIGSIKLESNTVRSVSGNLVLQSSGGTTQINDTVYLNNATNSTSKDTGALIVEGGVGIEKDVYVGGDIYGNGIIVGTATSSNTIRTVASSTNALFYPTFVDSNNAVNTYESVYTSGGLVYNPSTGNLGIGSTTVIDTLAHGGTNVVTQIYNASTTTDSQGHILIGTGNTGPNSSVGSISWGLPRATATNRGIAYIAGRTGTASTTGAPSGRIVFATRNTTDPTFISRAILDESGNFILNPAIASNTNLQGTGTANQLLQVTGGAYVSGNLGIGTTNPGLVNLSILGSVEQLRLITPGNVGIANTTVFLRLNDVNGQAGYFGFGGGVNQLDVWNYRGGNIRLGTNNIERVTVISDGNVGVGSTLPTTKLQVAGDVTPSVTNTYNLGSASLRWDTIYGNTFNGQQFVGNSSSSDTVRTVASSTNALFYPTFVDSNNVSAAYESVYTSGGLVYNPSTGNLGIGTTNATQKLSVYGVIESLNDGANEGGNLVLRGQPGTPSRWNIDNHTSFSGGVINQFRIFREDEQTGLNGKTYLGISTVGEVIIGNGPIGIYLTPTGTSNQQLQVQSGAYVSGNLGIGITNPQDTLSLQGMFRIDRQLTAQDQAYIRFFRQGTEKARLGLISADNGIYINGSASDNANHLVITNSGNLGIGSAIPTSKLQVAGDVTPSVNNAYDLGSASLRWRNVFATTFNGAFQGNADTATKLLTARNIAITGDLSWNVNFDGSANVTSTGTLASTGVVANTYGSSTQVPVFAVDSKGRITSVSNTGINFSTATVLNSDNVKTVTNSTNGTFYPTFVDNDNSPAAYEAVYTDAGISYNPSTNLLTSGRLNLSDATASTITSVLSRGADNNFQLSAQNGPATNASGQEVSRFGINYSGSGWNSYFKFIRGGGTADGSITIATNNTDRVQINSSGNVLPQGTSGTLDLGGASNRWGTVYANTFNGLNNITTVDLQTGNLLVTGIATVNGFFRPSVGSGTDKGIYWQPDPAGGAGDEAFIRYYAESGEDTILHIGIRNDGVVGNSDNIYLEAAGGVNVSTSLSAPQLINTGFDFILGNGDQSTRGNSGNSRALVKSSGSTLTLNFGGDFTGGIVAGSTLYPTTNGTLNLGGTSNYWNNVYANNFVGAVTGTATNATTALYLNTAQSSSDRDDITTRLNSGFWQTSSATTAEGWPTTTNGWYHLISSTHSNEANYYALQLAAPFFSQNLYYRSTNASGATPWTEVITAANITSNPSFSALQTTANNAGSAAAAAQGTANTALTNANNAGTAAAAAQGTANTALTNANNAQTTANTALTNANNAQTTADTAITLINGGGGSVTVNQTGYSCTNPITTSGSTINIASNSNAYGTRYIQSTQPLSACEGDIWYDTQITTKLVQVTNTVVSTAPHFTTASGNFVPTGFSASITPTSSASRIIVMINGSVYNANAGCGVVWGVYCNGTIITPAIYGTFDSAGGNLASAALTLTHSPGTTATCTYEVYIAVTVGGTGYWFGSGYGSFITLMEVLG